MYDAGDMATIGRPKTRDRAKVRSKVVPPIRVTEAELKRLKDAAEADGQTIGLWLLDLGLKRARRVLK